MRRRRLLAISAVSFALSGSACARAALEPSAAPLEVVVTAPAEPPVATATSAPKPPVVSAAPAVDAEPEPATLPRPWAEPTMRELVFTDVLARARAARAGFERLVVPSPSAQETAVRAWFTRAMTQTDQASRLYAAAFYAIDATREGRIDAIAEAAEQAMTMARALDTVGLEKMPPSWRADPSLQSTFEDVAIGPTRRWRDEARALARQCVQTAHDDGVVTAAARRCASLPTGLPARSPLAPVAQPPGAAAKGSGCACDPGDPLCSASLSGWCPK